MPDGGSAQRMPRVVVLDPFDEHGTTVVVVGDLDRQASPQLERAIATQIADGHRHFVIDLSLATFLDSVAVGTLLRSIEPLSDDADAGVVLAGANGVIERALVLSGIGQMFTMFETRAAAIVAVSGPRQALRQTWRGVRRRRYPPRW